MVDEIPGLVRKFGKDGEKVKAFVEDAREAIDKATTDEQKVALYGALMLVMLMAIEGLRGLKRFNIFADPFKPMRIKCDDVARIMDFKRYKALRNIP
jgi:hypothetical protein